MHMHDMVNIDTRVFDIVRGGGWVKPPYSRIVSCLKYPGSDRVRTILFLKKLHALSSFHVFSVIIHFYKIRCYFNFRVITRQVTQYLLCHIFDLNSIFQSDRISMRFSKSKLLCLQIT